MKPIKLFQAFSLSVTIGLLAFPMQATAYEELDCDQIKRSHSKSCSVCFEGGIKKIGEVFRPNMVFNASQDVSNVYFEDENKIVSKFQSLNPNTSWFVSDNLLQYPDDFVWNIQPSGDFSGRKFHYFPKWSSERILETQEGKGIRLQDVKGALNDDWDFKLTFMSKYRVFVSTEKIGKSNEIHTCIFYKGSTSKS